MPTSNPERIVTAVNFRNLIRGSVRVGADRFAGPTLQISPTPMGVEAAQGAGA
jgi:hypothetical protein